LRSSDEFPHQMNALKGLPGGRLVALGAVVALLLIPVLASAGQGDPDRSFGSAGVATLPRNDTLLRGAAVQRDGKLVAVGELGRDAGAARLLVARFNRNGSLDRSFAPSGGLPLLGGGSGGIYVGPVGTTGNAVAIGRNGRILVAGGRTDSSGSDGKGMLVMRLNGNGSLDRSFSGDGVATALTTRSGAANGIAVRGRQIVLAGAATLGSAERDAFSRVAVARFRINGAHDRTFGHRGAEVLDFGRLSVANAVAIRPGGGILLVGSVRNNLQSTELLAARLRPSGAADRRFNSDGVFIHQYGRGGAFSSANDLLPAAGGLIAAGVASSASQGPMAIAVRINSHGRQARGFSGDGAAYLRAAKDSDQYDKVNLLAGAYGIARAGKRLVLGGAFDSLGLKRLAVWGLKANGRIAGGFGQHGRTVTPGPGSAELSDLVRARNGKLYGVGDRDNFVDPSTGLAARYQGG
jgi:uncharacterized delta-60 repeat protein